MGKLILASGSPRRAELLKSAGFEFEVRAADIDESPLASEAASDYVIRVARQKAQSVAPESPTGASCWRRTRPS
jgi:septum formation protein